MVASSRERVGRGSEKGAGRTLRGAESAEAGGSASWENSGFDKGGVKSGAGVLGESQWGPQGQNLGILEGGGPGLPIKLMAKSWVLPPSILISSLPFLFPMTEGA